MESHRTLRSLTVRPHRLLEQAVDEMQGDAVAFTLFKAQQQDTRCAQRGSDAECYLLCATAVQYAAGCLQQFAAAVCLASLKSRLLWPTNWATLAISRESFSGSM